ncbi:MAG: (2Fe-2S)-binding protein [Candidatus Ranarchaeia archaeon]
MKIKFVVNGEPRETDVEPDDMLIDVIRDKLGLTGAKANCRIGTCGLCMVIMDGKPVKSCQIPAVKAQGASIVTVEGIGTPTRLHPLQQAFIDYGAVQCGYCKPAFIVAAYALLQTNPNPNRSDIVRAINPILCRCTGYHQIIEAIEAVVRGEYD